ncbi:MAG: hypothetical protein JWP87_768, partial [Labilithrix sp.]|nr:hypothetical protein [Labilithrix sp.]
MSRFRTTSTSRLLLIFAGLGAACGPIDDPVTASLNDEDVTNANQNAAKGSTLRDGDYPEYSSVKKAFSDVAQRIVGIDPKTQKITNVGLQNLAYELGFAYSANSCGTDWDVVAPASGKVVITSNHQTGAGPGCNQGPDRDTPTKYTLSDWYLADTKTELVKYEQ